MEPAAGAVSEVEEWSSSSFDGFCYEEAHFMAQLLGSCSFSSGIPSSSFPVPFPADDSHVKFDHDAYSCRQGRVGHGRGPGGDSVSSSSRGLLNDDDNLITMDYGLMDSKHAFSDNEVAEGGDFLILNAVGNDSFMSDEKGNGQVLLGGKKSLQLGLMLHEMVHEKDKSPISFEKTRKRARITRDLSADQVNNSRSVKLKRSLSLDHKQNWPGWCSMDESDPSFQLNYEHRISKHDRIRSSNISKPRAGRGSATDPQSIYARKRRERINERLRILQNLIPNGTKVDISTMLDEAVQYVKFLQLQIKMLSSDDLWMYAPIAYNGMDIGLDIKIPLPHSDSFKISSPESNSQS